MFAYIAKTNLTSIMKSKISHCILVLSFVLFSIYSCQTSQIDKLQGVYKADKKELKTYMDELIGTDNFFMASLLDGAIENAIIEFKINGDSINGLMSMVGESTVLNSKINFKNDSIIVKSENSNVYLIPSQNGIIFKNKNATKGITLLKSDQKDLSNETKKAIKKVVSNKKELKEFNDSLGKWQIGNVVDEFGDDTGKSYPYSLVIGEHENSIATKTEVYVKTTIQKDELYFQIYNKSMTLKESFPESKFGEIKIKYPSGEVETEKAFFFKNTISESPKDKNNLIHNHITKETGELKILIDLSTASSYYTDRYQFAISKSNLDKIIPKL